MSDITEQEKSLIAEFRESIKDLQLTEVQNDSRFLIRWIRGKDHDLIKAEEMLRKSMKWRKANDIDNIGTWKVPDSLRKGCPMVAPGLDKQGCQVLFMPLGSWDLKKIVSTGQREEFLKFIDQWHDQTLGKPHPNGSTQVVLVMDMDHYSLRQFSSSAAVETVLELMRRYDSNYPETLKCGIFLNSSKVFSMLFALVKPAMGKQFKTVQVFDNGSEKAKAYLHERIPLETLPTKFGGTNVEAQRILYGDEKK